MDRKIAGIGIGAILTLTLFIVMGLAFAQNTETTSSKNFVDSDEDGVCDHAGSCPYKNQESGFINSDENDVCDHAGSCPYKNQDSGFVDSDEDGVCDHAGSCPKRENRNRCSGGCHTY